MTSWDCTGNIIRGYDDVGDVMEGIDDATKEIDDVMWNEGYR